MSITLPPLPVGAYVMALYRSGYRTEMEVFSREEMTAYATAAVEAYIASGVPMTDAQVAAYGTASVEADRASRVPTIDYAELHEFARLNHVGYNELCCVVRRAVHRGIGAKP